MQWKGKDLHFSRLHLPLFLSLNDGYAHLVVGLLDIYPGPERKLKAMIYLLELRQRGLIEELA